MLLSGGLDSSVLLYWASERFDRVDALTIYYGQKQVGELTAARCIAERAPRVSHVQLDLTSLRPIMASSALVGWADVPKGDYSPDSMKATLVPNRNMIMIAAATALAIDRSAGSVCYGPHADPVACPDSRPPFVKAMREALETCHTEPIGLHTPFLEWSKSDIVHYGGEVGVPFELTWSCFEEFAEPCGKCSACNMRRVAFEEAGISDPHTSERKVP